MSTAGLGMPPLDDISGINMLNVVLDRTLVGLPKTVRSYPITGVFVNLCRLTDKAINEYKAARAAVMDYVSSEGNPAYLLRAIEHLENCIDAIYRAVLNGEALRNNNIGRGAPRLTDKQRASLKAVRDAIEHSDERLLQLSRGPSRPWFQQGQPFSLFITDIQAVGSRYHQVPQHDRKDTGSSDRASPRRVRLRIRRRDLIGFRAITTGKHYPCLNAAASI
jgi:hypothetical protein